MADKIRANYPAMQEMAKHMDLVKSRLTELAGTSNKIAQQMQAGALTGQPGEAFEASLGVLTGKINTLAEKFGEISKDINLAVSDMQSADQSAAGDIKL